MAVSKKKVATKAKKPASKKKIVKVELTGRPKKLDLFDVLHMKILCAEKHLGDSLLVHENAVHEKYCQLTTRVVEMEERTKRHMDACIGQINAMSAMWEDQDHNFNNKYLELYRSLMSFLQKHEPVDTEFMGRRLDALQDAIQQLATKIKELSPELS